MKAPRSYLRRLFLRVFCIFFLAISSLFFLFFFGSQKKEFDGGIFPTSQQIETMAVVQSAKYLGGSDWGGISRQDDRLWFLVLVLLVTGVCLWLILERALAPVYHLKNHIEDLSQGYLKSQFEGGETSPKEILSMVADLSKLVRDFRKSQKAVFKSQAQQEVVLENMDEGVLSINEDGKVNHMNSAAENILGCTIESGEEVHVQSLVQLPILKTFIKETVLERRRGRREIVIDGGALSERVFIVRSSPVFSFKSKYRGAIFVFVEVSELRKLERHRQEFVSNASHELKTPLTSIKGYAETMQNPAFKSQEDFRRFSRVIQKHADHLDSLIDNLLMLSELESGDRVTNVQWVSLGDIVQGALDVCFQKALDKGVKIVTHSLEKVEFKVNPILLTQALVNLVDNAIKYSSEKTTVTIYSSREGHFMDLVVADNGPGIQDNQKLRLFERFYRIDKGRSRDRGGTGLGLSIVRHIMYAHGGEAGILSTSSKGSQFYLRVPINEW